MKNKTSFVIKVIPEYYINIDNVIKIAASIGIITGHSYTDTIADYAKSRKIEFSHSFENKSIRTDCISGNINGLHIMLGQLNAIKAQGIKVSLHLNVELSRFYQKNNSVIGVAVDSTLLGLIIISAPEN